MKSPKFESTSCLGIAHFLNVTADRLVVLARRSSQVADGRVNQETTLRVRALPDATHRDRRPATRRTSLWETRTRATRCLHSAASSQSEFPWRPRGLPRVRKPIPAPACPG